jgi:hypothetical protein
LNFYNYEDMLGFGLGCTNFVVLSFIGFISNIQNFLTCPSIEHHVYL